ncbi:MAG: hypothetical protein JNJ47_03180 [Alphaproteobacteria bacterium]|nr:hypothetical protein [Alphaproteobacteria bacterium]
MARIITIPCLIISLAWGQFADQKIGSLRYLGDFEVSPGISEAESGLVLGFLKSAYSSAGKFEIWTSKNVKQKLSKEAAKGAVSDCLDTSCVT